MADLVKSDSNRAADATDDAGTATTAMPVQPLKTSTAPLRRASSGSMQEFVEVDGTTTFMAPPAPTYRYKLSLRSGLLRVWIENCESKQQWCTSDLTVDTYVDINNAVPGAVAADYVECFRTLLNKTVEGSNEIPRVFKRTKGDAFRLEISMKVQVLTQTRVATYSFDMEPISVERIDLLESRMRDLQEEMKALRVEAAERTQVVELQETVNKLQEMVKKRQPQFRRQAENSDLQSKETGVESNTFTFEAKATTKTSRDVIFWSATGNYTNASDGHIRNLEPGTYQVTALVNYKASANDQMLQLAKGGQRVQRICCRGSDTKGVLECTVNVVEGDQLSVVCTADLISSSLTVRRVGS